MITREVKPNIPAQYRQGDVFLQEVDSLPSFAKEVQVTDRIVLQYGTATGHAHAIAKDKAVLFEGSGRRFVIPGIHGAPVSHEEHDTIELPAGKIFEVILQREFSVLTQMSRTVLD